MNLLGSLAEIKLWGMRLSSRLWRLEAIWRGVSCPSSVTFLGHPVFARFKNSEIILSDGVQVNSSVRSNTLGCFQPMVLRTMAEGARIELGKGVGVSGGVICAAKSVTIGEGTILGSGAMVVDHDFHEPEGEWGWNSDCLTSARPVRIGRGVFIGARAIILKGVTLGDRAVIGAGAVVTKDVPAGMLAAGNPAKVISRSDTPPAGKPSQEPAPSAE